MRQFRRVYFIAIRASQQRSGVLQTAASGPAPVDRMTVLFGHPTGNPNSHHAALAHFEAGHLECLCVPWMPSKTTVRLLERIVPLRRMAQRFGRRHFPQLAEAPKVQARMRELRHLMIKTLNRGNERPSDAGNTWLMRTMSRECRRPRVTAVHAYVDCSLWQFAVAKRVGKACIYDLPIGHHAAWDEIRIESARKYPEWLPEHGSCLRQMYQERILQEMQLADLVLVPSSFVADTVRRFNPEKPVAFAPYGVDVTEWPTNASRSYQDAITFIFAGQCSLRKGTPLLLEAWKAADLKDATLQLVGPWQLAQNKKKSLPAQCFWAGPVSSRELLQYYHDAHVFVFPTNFEGRALVIGEAMAAGLPVVTTEASGWGDVINTQYGRLVPPGDLDALIECLRWFARHRDRLPAMSRAARAAAESSSWETYRRHVSQAVAPFA